MTKKPRHKEPTESSEASSMTTSDALQQTWRTCVICLSEKFDDEMRTHQSCGGLICRDCVVVTANHHDNRNFPCPVRVWNSVFKTNFLLLWVWQWPRFFAEILSYLLMCWTIYRRGKQLRRRVKKVFIFWEMLNGINILLSSRVVFRTSRYAFGLYLLFSKILSIRTFISS